MPAFESFKTTAYGSRTNTSIAAPTGVEVGDLLILDFVNGNSGGEAVDPTAPDGFTIAPGSWPIDVESGGFNIENRQWRKVADSDDVTLSGASGSYTVTHATASSRAVLMRVSDVNPTTPDAVTPTLTSGAGTVSTAASLTTPVDECLIIVCGFDFGDTSNTLNAPSGTTPVFTKRVDTTLATVSSGTLASAGATGDKTYTNNNAGSVPWGVSMIALAPAAAVPAFTDDPEVTGTVQVGETLTTTDGTITGSPAPAITYQWQHDNEGADSWDNVSGETGSSFVLTVDELFCNVRCVVIAENDEGLATGTSNQVGPVAAAPLDFSIRLSGGSSNTVPLASIGGVESSHFAAGGSLFGSVSASDADAGLTDYRCVYLHNDDVQDATVVAWLVDDDDAFPGRPYFAVGAATQAAGSTVTAIANPTTAPAGVTFDTDTTVEDGVDLGTVTAGDGKGVWVRRAIPSSTSSGVAHNEARIRFQITPVE